MAHGLNLRAAETLGLLGQPCGRDVGRNRPVAHVDLEDFFASRLRPGACQRRGGGGE